MELNEALRSVRALSTLADTDLDALASALQVDDRPDGYAFVREGARGDTAFLIVSGHVSVTRNRGGAEVEINRMGPGQMFGLVALVDDEPRSATCRAAGPVRVASLPRSAFVLLYNAHAPVAYALQRALAEQLAEDFRNLDRRIRAARRNLPPAAS